MSFSQQISAHNINLRNITILQQKSVNITIINLHNILVFVKLNSSGQELWIYTFYDIRITALFVGNLSVEVYPAFPFSDATPRKLFFIKNDTRTVNVFLYMGNILHQILSSIASLISILSTIGVIKHITKTPVSNATSIKTRSEDPLITILHLLLITFSSLVISLYIFYLPSWFTIVASIILISTFLSLVLMGKYWPLLLPSSIFLLILLILIKSPALMIPDFTTSLIIVMALLLYPFVFYISGKSLTLALPLDRSFKIYLMHLYDITLLIWIFQWFINPYPAMLSWELQFAPSLLSGYAILVSIVMIVIFSVLFVADFVRFWRNASLILPSLLKLPLTSSLIRYMSFFSLLLLALPFVLNRELVARGELCASAERGVVKVRIHLEDCCDPVEGVVVGCSLEKIAVDDGSERRVFSWGDAWQIELIG